MPTKSHSQRRTWRPPPERWRTVSRSTDSGPTVTGYLREYKQRKRRHQNDPYRYGDAGVSRNGYSILTLYLSRRRKQKLITRLYRDTEEASEKQRKENLKRMNRIRVNRHRQKVKKLLEEPVIIEEKGEKCEYEKIFLLKLSSRYLCAPHSKSQPRMMPKKKNNIATPIKKYGTLRVSQEKKQKNFTICRT